MRVLQIIEGMDPRSGGPVRYIQDLARAMAPLGVESTILTTDRAYDGGRLDVPLGVEVAGDGYSTVYCPVEFAPLLVSIGLWRELERRMATTDLVHIHGLYRFPSTAAAHLARRSGKPYVLRTHGSLDPYLFNKPERRLTKRIWERLFEYRNLNRASAIHYTALGEQEKLRPLGLTAPGVVIPNGVDLASVTAPAEKGEMRRRLGIGDAPLIVSVGRLAPQKGFDRLIRAFAVLQAETPDARLVIAGPEKGPYGDSLRALAVTLGVGDKVVFAGMLDRTELNALLSDADVFGLASRAENFGIAVVEALARGAPSVISPSVDIWPELEAREAAVVADADPETFARALKRVLEDPDLRRRLSINGAKTVRELFAISDVAGRMVEFYRSLIPAAPAPSPPPTEGLS